MKRIINCFLLLVLLVLVACSEPAFKKGKGAMQYKIVEDHGGPVIGKLATVFLSYAEFTGNGKILSGTGLLDAQLTKVYATNTQFEGDLQDAFQYLSDGDSAVVKVSLDSIKRVNLSPILAKDTSKYMTYTLRIHKVINQNGSLDTTYFSRVRAYEDELKQKRKTEEAEKVKKYLSVNKLNYKATSSGLLYPADLKKVNNAGEELYVNYELTSLDGKQFLTKYERIKPEQARFLGLKEALLMTPKGMKTKVVMPSQLAYGSVGDNSRMAPYTPLICEFTILNK